MPDYLLYDSKTKPTCLFTQEVQVTALILFLVSDSLYQFMNKARGIWNFHSPVPILATD